MFRWAVFGVLLAAAACDDDGAARARLDRIEAQLAQLEARGTVGGTPAAMGGAVEDELRALERRLAAVETRLAEREALGADAGKGAFDTTGAPMDGRREQRQERRQALRDLTAEYRARLAAIRQEETDPVARQQAVREALEWYRQERRAVLEGRAPATP